MSDVIEQQASGELHQVAGDGDWHGDSHPTWCSAEHCFINEEGNWVYVQAPVYWEYKEAAARVETRLIDPPDGPSAYLELCATTPKSHGGYFFYTIMPVAVARQLCDQLTAHLNTAEE